jgi:hypothetical protein
MKKVGSPQFKSRVLSALEGETTDSKYVYFEANISNEPIGGSVILKYVKSF